MNSCSNTVRPNLFLVGAAKSGTTALARCLSKHPQVCVAEPKEPNFFAFVPDQPARCRGPIETPELSKLLLGHTITNQQAYEAAFQEADATYLCDASVRYLYTEDAANRIHAYAPDARIMAVLRDPVSRINSHYHMNVRLGIEPASLPCALDLEDSRVADGWGWDWHYLRVSCYGEQLERYYARFPREQILVLDFQDLQRHPRACIQQILEFLELPQTPGIDLEPANVGHSPRFPALRRMLWEDNAVKSMAQVVIPSSVRKFVSERIESVNRREVPDAPCDVRQRLQDRLDEDRECLEQLTRRRLSW